MATETIWLQRPNWDVPWGFRLQGGRDFHMPLTVQRVSPGSIAATGLSQGDVILRIGETDTHTLTFNQSQELVKNCGNLIQLHIAKGGVRSPGPDTQFATKLDEQLARLKMPSSAGAQYGGGYHPQTPSKYGGPPGAPDYSYQSPVHSPVSAPGYSPGYIGSPTAPLPQPTHQQQQQQPMMPDKVLNMAARGPPEKKPWSYAPDLNQIKEQRAKVRRRTAPRAALPHYQHMLNMPSFSESPPMYSPQTPPAQARNHPLSDQDEALVAHAQYNSPLDLYSEQNVAETFAGQSEGVVTNVVKAGAKKDPQNITMSPVYKMIHGLDEPKPKLKPVVPEGHSRPVREPSADDELHFSGVHNRSNIPSKSFQRLQHLTGGSEIDETPIRSNITGEEEDADIGNYDEASIRYRGTNIPSRSFRMLQSMTGGDNLVPPPAARRPRKKQAPRPTENASEENPDDTVDISYVGSAIPSRSFRMLQQYVGEPETDVAPGSPQPAPAPAPALAQRNPSPISIPAAPISHHIPQVIPEKQRHRRRRPDDRVPEHHLYTQTSLTDDEQRPFQRQSSLTEQRQRPQRKTFSRTVSESAFDELAYLSGKVPILRDPTEAPKRAPIEIIPSSQSLEPADENDQEFQRPFDENAFLGGQISLWGDQPKLTSVPAKESVDETPEWVTKAQTSAPFDEDVYLAGKDTKGQPDQKPEWLNLAKQKREQQFNEEAYFSARRASIDVGRKQAPWEKAKIDDEVNSVTNEFDEREYLSGRIAIIGGDPKLHPPKARTAAYMPQADEDKPREEETDINERPFDEQAYLRGRIPLVKGGDADLSPIKVRRRKKPVGEEEDETDNKVPFDESAYLSGNLPILGGSTESALPPRAPRKKPQSERAPWQKDDDAIMTDDEYDEDAYLRGRIAVVRSSAERDTTPDAQHRDDRKKRKYRERAPWERETEDELDGQTSDAEFDESSYLRGRVPTVSTSADRDLPEQVQPMARIPSKIFLRLSRSVSRDNSREESPASQTSEKPRRRTNSVGRLQDTSDPNHAISDMRYVGTSIPSKTFAKLQRNIEKMKPPEDPFDRLRGRRQSRENEGIDVDLALDKLDITEAHPSSYFEKLKETVEESENARAAAADKDKDVTDF